MEQGGRVGEIAGEVDQRKAKQVFPALSARLVGVEGAKAVLGLLGWHPPWGLL
jgi:hypothetical protein